MKYFKDEENPAASLPRNFMQSFLEVCFSFSRASVYEVASMLMDLLSFSAGPELIGCQRLLFYLYIQRIRHDEDTRVLNLCSRG